MKTFVCECGNTIFYENTRCVCCGSELGWCPSCTRMTSLRLEKDGHRRCGNSDCNVLLMKCSNYSEHHVCNHCVPVSSEAERPEGLCDYCDFNDTIPDLTVAGNREMWKRLEEAKRRLLYTLDLLRLPYGKKSDGVLPRLNFDFKADAVGKPDQWWWSLGKEERVFTGHADGKITINLREADTVEREKARVLFQEAHRTVIGHFRHEIAHYYWEMLVKGKAESEFKAVFGDHENPTYAECQSKYYKKGPVANWQSSFVSGYAAMHPWEDFAETFATYLDMVSVLDTAMNMNISPSCNPVQTELAEMVSHYIKLGVLLNEMNRAMGLIDYVPEILVSPVVVKMQYIHDLLRNAAEPLPAASPPTETPT
ncbi:zinc-binding metallopeptidase family protein [Novipirellula artificiosorum]|uniref:Zinc-ribbon domain-containing protein n=1 Tax=Novipirellula artificiosorum TaxID=2528016 RepID=A0A5C6E0X8_9BACT|nr:putative zinc-binding metallopeptidase [Novipirellula artificiosorum]TWU42558.1 hypothetical protein Poly41_08550 [Novipirellula artificiosorum]